MTHGQNSGGPVSSLTSLLHIPVSEMFDVIFIIIKVKTFKLEDTLFNKAAVVHPQ